MKGKEILKKGDCSNYIFLLVDGEIELQFNFENEKEGRSSVFDVLKPGNIGFIYSSIEEQAQPFSVVAKTNCNVLIAPQSVIKEISKDNRNFKENHKVIKNLLDKDEFPLFNDFALARGHKEGNSDDSSNESDDGAMSFKEANTARELITDKNKVHPITPVKPTNTFDEENRKMRILFRLAVLRVMKNIQKVKISSNASL